MGISIASGAPSVVPGLLAAVIGAILVKQFRGAPYVVVGPAAGLAILVANLVNEHGWRTFCVVVVLAGLLQVVFGLLKISRIALAISPAVVHGMLAGIGIVIIMAQIQVLLGASPKASAVANLRAMPTHLKDVEWVGFGFGMLALAIIIGWSKLPRRYHVIPAALVAVIVPSIFALDHYDLSRIKIADNLLEQIRLPVLPSDWTAAIFVGAFSLALVSSIELLICIVATEKMHQDKPANMDRELLGTGVANVLCGLVGALPLTGEIVRSSVNINQKASSQWSVVLHGVWIALFVLAFQSVLRYIPTAVLAGLLIYVGFRLINLEHLKQVRQYNELPIYLLTCAGVVFKDLLAGVILGFGCAVAVLLYRMSSVKLALTNHSHEYLLEGWGAFTFLSVPKLSTSLQEVEYDLPVRIVIHYNIMDHATYEHLEQWKQNRESMGQHVEIEELHVPLRGGKPKVELVEGV